MLIRRGGSFHIAAAPGGHQAGPRPLLPQWPRVGAVNIVFDEGLLPGQ